MRASGDRTDVAGSGRLPIGHPSVYFCAMQTTGGVLDELRWRGLVYQHTDGVADALAAGPVSAYIGFDPTGSSLHVGSLVPIMVLVAGALAAPPLIVRSLDVLHLLAQLVDHRL